MEYNSFSNENSENDIHIESKKPGVKKRFYIFAVIFISAVITILYISNLMYVNKLMKEVHYLNKEYQKIVITNENLQARIANLESPDRIIPYATDRLGMIRSEEAPIFIK
jgi:cell division protein FtsB